MVAQAILKWGSDYQRETWLPMLSVGKMLGAFAATETNVGSDLKSVETTAERARDGYVLNGLKRWITFGQVADLFLVLARCDGKPAAFLIERGRSNLSTQPIKGMLGVKASMMADLLLEDCWIPEENLVGRVGFGLLTVISDALSLGRYSVAWGCVGIAQACLDAALHYTSERRQFGLLLREHQLIQEMIGEMVTGLKAARLLCCRAGYLKDAGDEREVMETFIAKYFASRAAMKAALDAVQIHGANGCSSQYPVQRYLRDAKVMEIIEGSNQIQQMTISGYGYQEYAQHVFEQTAGAEKAAAGQEKSGAGVKGPDKDA
jgi:alkylation response protein AidB-like acyl-CoA dehydrogenase